MNFVHELENPELLKKVISILEREFKVLPKFGTIAGGAVSSAIFEALDITDINIKRYKDLDVFWNRKRRSKEPLPSGKRFPPLVKESERGIGISGERFALRQRAKGFTANYSNSYDGHISTSVAARNQISIINSITNELKHNYIEIGGLTNPKESDDESLAIISSFDLTSSAVCINESRTKILFTAGFLNFLYQKKINIQLLETAKHTLIRYLDACEHFNQQPDNEILERLADAITLVTQLTKHHKSNVSRHNSTPYLHGYLFSNIYHSRAIRHKDTLNRLGLKLTPIVIGKAYFDRKHHYLIRNFKLKHSETRSVKKQWKVKSICLYEMKSSRQLTPLGEDLFELLRHKSSSFKLVYSGILNHTLQRPTQKGFEADQEHRQWFEMDIAVNYPDFNIKSLHNSTLESLIYLMAGHNSRFVMEIAQYYSLTNQTGAAIKGLKWLDKHHALILGLIENNYRHGNIRSIREDVYLKRILLSLNDLKKLKLLTERRVYIHHLTVHQRNFAARHETSQAKVNNMFEDKRVYCEEITKEYELVALGELQRHCVGGYFSTIYANHGSIFKVTGPDKKDVSTLFITHPNSFNYKPYDDQEDEIERETIVDKNSAGERFYIAEHRTYGNQDPSSIHKDLARALHENLQDAFEKE